MLTGKPNTTTLVAMQEAENSDNLETLDLADFRKFVDSLTISSRRDSF